jgi:protein TonB
MKLDLLKDKWLEIVFEGRNKVYGAYELRKANSKTTLFALISGTAFFAFALSLPLLFSLLPDNNNDEVLDEKITTVKLPPKEKPKENIPPPPPPPPPKVDQVKFVKPVVAKADEVTEEPPKVEEIKDKKLGAETIKGDPDAPLSVEPVGNGPSQVVEEDNNIYNTAGIEVKPDFPGGLKNFYKLIANNYETPEDCAGGRVFVNFVVEKDGSLTDIKVIRDACPGSGKEAIRVLKSCPRWNPGEQNGKKVRVLYSLPITIQSTE